MIAVATRVGRADGARAAAAALACATSDAGRAGLLLDLEAERPPRPSLIATAAARQLEERLTAHLPGAAAAARGQICVVVPPAGDDDARVEQAAAALPLVRDSLVVIHLPPRLLQPVLSEARLRPSGALLRADLPAGRALTALAVGELMESGIVTVVLKRPLPWLSARAALLGALPDGAGALPDRVGRLLP